MIIDPFVIIGKSNQSYSLILGNNTNDTINLFIYDMFAMTDSFILISLVILVLIRLWLLVFDHNFGLANVDRIWRETINANEISFWITYRQKFGQLKYFYIAMIIFLTLELLMNNIWNMAHIYQSTQIILSILCILLIIFVLRLFNGLSDPHAIKKEMKCLILLMSLYTFISLIITTISMNKNTFEILEFGCRLCNVLYFLSMTFCQVKPPKRYPSFFTRVQCRSTKHANMLTTIL